MILGHPGGSNVMTRVLVRGWQEDERHMRRYEDRIRGLRDALRRWREKPREKERRWLLETRKG